jgi:hypothetical protein
MTPDHALQRRAASRSGSIEAPCGRRRWAPGGPRPRSRTVTIIAKTKSKMHKTMLFLGCFLALALIAAEPAKPKKLTAEDAIKLWSPLLLKTAQDYGQMGATPEQSPNVAAYSFRVIGPTFEELWNHYAQLCGMKQRYEEKTFLISGDTGPNGSYVVSDRMPAPGKLDRGLSVFLLKTDSYTVTATFQADPDGKSITGSLTAVTSQ